MRHAIVAALLLAALLPAPATASYVSTLLHMHNLTASNWEAGSALQRSAPETLHSNCGYLSYFVATTCTTMRAGMQRACCEALCAWNAAGCACLPDAAGLVRSVPVANRPLLKMDLTPSSLVTSICNFSSAELFAPGHAGSCASVPAGGSTRCPAAKPARESRCVNPANLAAKRKINVAALIEAAYLPLHASPGTVRTALKNLLTSKGEVLAPTAKSHPPTHPPQKSFCWIPIRHSHPAFHRRTGRWQWWAGDRGAADHGARGEAPPAAQRQEPSLCLRQAGVRQIRVKPDSLLLPR